MADRRDADALQKQILQLLEKNPDKAYRAKEISRALNVTNQGRYQTLLEVVDDLRDSGTVDSARGRIQHRAPRNEAEGILSVAQQGFGFVMADNGEEFFVRPRRMGTALHGDRVRVALAAETKNKKSDEKREAEVIALVERNLKRTVGTFSTTGKSGWVVPDDKRVTHDVYVARDGWNGAEPGHKVVVSIDDWRDPKAAPEGTILSVIGRTGEPGVDVLALAMAHGAPSDFPKEVEAAADKIKIGITKKEVARRLDLRDAPVFTIDPADAKDFDDAIHTKDLGDGMTEIGVHIADVSHYVEQGGAIDKEAYDRATSTYLVDRVIPMLPEVLSNGVCSLRPHEDKLAYSCIMAVDGGGNVHSWEIRETVIHSKHRFAYEDAQAVIEGGDHPFKDEVLRAAEMARTLTKKRMSEGAIDFDVPEVRIRLDEQGKPVDVYEKERQEANRLIEEFMLLANQSVAVEAENREVPVPVPHPRQAGPRAHHRAGGLRQDVRLHPAAQDRRRGSVGVERPAQGGAGTPEAPVIEQAAIRSMSKAVYSPDNIGHYGLGFSHYGHFTSPIRRYPDLIAHRILKRMQDQQPGKLPSFETLEENGEHCSAREKEATVAERESIKLKQVEYAAAHLGDEFDGVVVGVTRFGVFVQMNKLMVEGLVHVRGMKGYWEYDERRYVLASRDAGVRIRVGDTCRVKIAGADPETRKVDLDFVTMPSRPGETGKPAPEGDRQSGGSRSSAKSRHGQAEDARRPARRQVQAQAPVAPAPKRCRPLVEACSRSAAWGGRRGDPDGSPGPGADARAALHGRSQRHMDPSFGAGNDGKREFDGCEQRLRSVGATSVPDPWRSQPPRRASQRCRGATASAT